MPAPSFTSLPKKAGRNTNNHPLGYNEVNLRTLPRTAWSSPYETPNTGSFKEFIPEDCRCRTELWYNPTDETYTDDIWHAVAVTHQGQVFLCLDPAFPASSRAMGRDEAGATILPSYAPSYGFRGDWWLGRRMDSPAVIYTRFHITHAYGTIPALCFGPDVEGRRPYSGSKTLRFDRSCH